jgi:hypothetical protein
MPGQDARAARAVGRRLVPERLVGRPKGKRPMGGGAGIRQLWQSSQEAILWFWKGKAGHRFQAKLRAGRPLFCWKPINRMVTWLPSHPHHRGGGVPCKGSLGDPLSR